MELLNCDLIAPNALKIAFEASLADFNTRANDVISQLEALPSHEHNIIWSGLFMIEKEAWKTMQRFLDDVEHHAGTINKCVTNTRVLVWLTRGRLRCEFGPICLCNTFGMG